MSKDQQNLNELVQNTFNNAKSKEAELEQASSLWKNYLELINIVEGVISKAEVPEEPAITLGALKHNLISAQTALGNLQVGKNGFMLDKYVFFFCKFALFAKRMLINSF